MNKDKKTIALLAEMDAALEDIRKVMVELKAKEDMLKRIRVQLDAELTSLDELRKKLANNLGIPKNPDAVWVTRSNIRALDRLAEMREVIWKLELDRRHITEFKAEIESEVMFFCYALCELNKSVYKIWNHVEEDE